MEDRAGRLVPLSRVQRDERPESETRRERIDLLGPLEQRLRKGGGPAAVGRGALAADTPEVVIDLGRVRANVERAARMAREAGVDLRPHTKTHKLPQIARMQVEAGAVGVQVAKLGEAEVMVDGGIEDVLVGYPI